MIRPFLKDDELLADSLQALPPLVEDGLAEVDDQDVWQRAVLGVACVSASASYAHGQLERVVQWIEDQRLDVELLDYEIEML